MAKLPKKGFSFPGNGTRVDLDTGFITNIAQEKKRQESWDKMTDQQKDIYREFQAMKAADEIKKYGHNKKLPTKNKK